MATTRLFRGLARVARALIGPTRTGLAAALVVVALVAWKPQPLLDLDNAVFDAFQRLAPRPPLAESPVRVIAIDAESLRRQGQWPWPRTDIAQLLRTLRVLGAASVAFDLVFAEPDRTSPERVADRLRQNAPDLAEALRRLPAPDHDARLAAEIARSPTALGVFLTRAGSVPPHAERQTQPGYPAGFAFAGGDPRSALIRFGPAQRNLPALERGAAGVGSISLARRRGGVVRSAPLLALSEDAIAPALSVEALRVALGERSYFVRASGAQGEAAWGSPTALVELRIGPYAAPLTRAGEIWVRYAAEPSSAPLPAWRLLDPDADRDWLRSEIAGRVILIGATAPGLRDLVATPLRDETPGVLVHAEIIEQIVQGDFLRRPDWIEGAEFLATLVIGVAVALSVARLAPAGAGLLVLAAMAASAAASWRAFEVEGLLLSPAGPILAAIAAVAGAGAVRFAQSERQRRVVRAQFENFVSAEIVEEIAANPERYLTPSGEVRDLSLMFADIRGFSQLSEGLDPETLIALLNDVLTPMAEAVIEEGGTVDKFIGDALMAFWNAPRATPDHPDRALSAALLLQHRVDALNVDFAAQGRPAIRVGVGVNTGACSVGAMGTRRRLDYSCIGDPVNLAARLEGLTRAYRVPICVGDATASLVSPERFALLELDRIRVKGRARPERVFALIGGVDAARDPAFERLTGQFRYALGLYHARAWDRATEGFAAAARTRVGGFDPAGLCEAFQTRIAAFRDQPPAPDWDGVWRAEEK